MEEEIVKPKLGKENKLIFLTLVIMIIILKLILTIMVKDINMDIGLYENWGNLFLENGSNIYNVENAPDYPPLYLYILAIPTFFANHFDIIKSFDIQYLGLKLVPIISDIIVAYLVFKYAIKHKIKQDIAHMIFLFLLIHPAIIINSSFWGQTDMFLTLFVIVGVFSYLNQRNILFTLSFALSVTFKPTALFFMPIYILLLFKSKNIKTIIKSLLIFIVVVIIVFLPFAKSFNFMKLFLHDIDKYNYASLHAYNLHMLIGGDFAIDTEFIGNLGITYKTLGISLTSLFLLGLTILFVKYHNNQNSFLFLWLYISGLFILMPRMHERYLFYAIIFSVLALIECYDYKLFILSMIQSVLIFFNHMAVYYFCHEVMQQNRDIWINIYNKINILFAFMNVAVFVLIVYFAVKNLTKINRRNACEIEAN